MTFIYNYLLTKQHLNVVISSTYSSKEQINQKFMRSMTMKNLTIIIFCIYQLSAVTVHASENPNHLNDINKHRLVIGIVVDQMRHDYISKYWNKYSDDGFKRMVREGFSFDDTHFDYMPTNTGPGHASVFTGTTPSIHGIMDNSWFDPNLRRSIYVTEDSTVMSVGTHTDAGKMSPIFMLSSTISDELRLTTNFRSKVVSISLKDRGAILPGGHTGDAYWFDSTTGHFITSTYYRNELPVWLDVFNRDNHVGRLLSNDWITLLPIETYVESIEDNNPYEGTFRGMESPTFPYKLPELVKNSGPGLIASTPFGNDLLVELAKSAITGETLGVNDVTDMLIISFSSPDYIGHRFGPSSIEVQDTYLRLDQSLAELFKYVDDYIGHENVLYFITSDHGAAYNTNFLSDRNIPTGSLVRREIHSELTDYTTRKYGFDPILHLGSSQIFLDLKKIDDHNLKASEISRDLSIKLLEFEGIAGALTYEDLLFNNYSDQIRQAVQKGFNAQRSGQVLFWLKPNWFSSLRRTGTTHGTAWNYDTRAPLIFFGWNIKSGNTTIRSSITDIAPTLANILGISYPSGNTGSPLNHFMNY